MDTPQATDDARAEARGNLVLRAGRITAILFALCVLYGLSLGPVVGVFAWVGINRGGRAEACAAVVYAPVWRLVDRTPVDGPLRRYSEWWDRAGTRLRRRGAP